MNLEKLGIGRNIKQNLKDCFAASADSDSYHLDFSCGEHQHYVRSMVIDVLARVCIYHFVRIRNRELHEIERSQKLKISRKAKKVKHC